MRRKLGGSGGAPTLDVDLYGERALADSRTLFASVRDAGPVVWLPRNGMYAIGRFDDVRAVLRDDHVFRSGEGVAANRSRTGSAATRRSRATPTRTRRVAPCSSARSGPPPSERSRITLRAEARAVVERLVDRPPVRGRTRLREPPAGDRRREARGVEQRQRPSAALGGGHVQRARPVEPARPALDPRRRSTCCSTRSDCDPSGSRRGAGPRPSSPRAIAGSSRRAKRERSSSTSSLPRWTPRSWPRPICSGCSRRTRQHGNGSAPNRRSSVPPWSRTCVSPRRSAASRAASRATTSSVACTCRRGRASRSSTPRRTWTRRPSRTPSASISTAGAAAARLGQRTPHVRRHPSLEARDARAPRCDGAAGRERVRGASAAPAQQHPARHRAPARGVRAHRLDSGLSDAADRLAGRGG